MKQKRSCLVDNVSLDSFYKNMLLGLVSFLKNSEFVTFTKMDYYPALTHLQLVSWEYVKGPLPRDFYDFYLCTNGLSFTYIFQSEKGDDASLVEAKIDINPLDKLDKVITDNSMYFTEQGTRVLAPNSRIFIISRIDDSAVVLAQFHTQKTGIWLYYKMKIFYFLCENLIIYLRMAVAYLGVPGWQFMALKAIGPGSSQEILQLLAPSIFENHFVPERWELNVIRPEIFLEPGTPESVKLKKKNKGKPPKKA